MLIGTRVRAQTLIHVFTCWLTVGLASEAAVTFTFIRAGQVHTLSPDTTDVLLGALIHVDALESPMLHHVFIALTTVAFVSSFYVDAKASAVAARF